MIKVKKPRKIPIVLSTDGILENARNERAYDLNPPKYIGGQTIIILSSIYNHPSVKKILKKAQYSKCCFCEKEQEDEFGAVEHYRPKSGYKSLRGDKLKKPGYFWLAYVWENLYFVCSACNSSKYKGNLFPLVDETLRSISHNDNYRNEDALLIDPRGKLNPRDHIYFENEFPRWKTDYGKFTIEICGLDRDALNNKRKKMIKNLNARLAILDKQAHFEVEVVEEAKKYIKDALKEKFEFSAAASDYLKNFKIVIT